VVAHIQAKLLQRLRHEDPFSPGVLGSTGNTPRPYLKKQLSKKKKKLKSQYNKNQKNEKF
jgi:hypothetical protein